jgi:hypothetical protein
MTSAPAIGSILLGSTSPVELRLGMSAHSRSPLIMTGSCRWAASACWSTSATTWRHGPSSLAG